MGKHHWKRKTYARGKELECFVEKRLRLLEWSSKLVYVRLKVDRRAGQEPGDFIIRSHRGCWLIDTKETMSERFAFNKGKSVLYQVEQMKKWRNFGTKVGFLIWFTEVDPGKNNLRFVMDFSEPATVASGERFDFELLI